MRVVDIMLAPAELAAGAGAGGDLGPPSATPRWC